VENTLLGAGVACIIAAIVGGGLKAFGMEIPLVNSSRRQLLLGFFGVVLVVISLSPIADQSVTDVDGSPGAKSGVQSRVLPHLSYGTWTLRNAIDDEGKNWSNSTLRFTSQEVTSDGLLLREEFTWRLDSILMGTEEFFGHYVDANRQVIFEGQAVRNFSRSEADRLAIGSYSAVVSADERTLIDGRWGSTMTNEAGVAGKWEAAR
jgi:hypothetical protein